MLDLERPSDWWPLRGVAVCDGVPWALAAAAATVLCAQAVGGPAGLHLAAAGLGALAAGLGALQVRRRRLGGIDPETGLGDRAAALACLTRLEASGDIAGRRIAVIAIAIENGEELRLRSGDVAFRALMVNSARRIQSNVRHDDLVARLDRESFVVILRGLRRADIEMLIQSSARIQRALAEPFLSDRIRVHATVSVGFCLPNRSEAKTGAAVLKAAERALEAARAETGGAIRAYSEEMLRKDQETSALVQAAAEALSNGEIRPWFQPQVSTDTGRVIGFSTEARWHRPDGEILVPDAFEQALVAAGYGDQLGEGLLAHALSALSEWDLAGLDVPGLSVRVSRSDLSNPRFVDRIRWEIDRFELDPGRLTLEVSGIPEDDGQDDMCIRNLRALARLGCQIDLDGFGTGTASLSLLRRVSVSRVRIDRSFAARIDKDPDQQRMLSAMLSLTEELGLITLASGVDTEGEHAMLAQLGCRHVQGRAVSPAMPASAVPMWLTEHVRRIRLPEIPGASDHPQPRTGNGKTA